MQLLSRLIQKLTKKPAITRLDLVLLAIGLGVFTTLSLITIASSSIWFDEAFSAYIIRFNLAEIWGYTAADVHPPLYYWLLKGWSVLFGTTDIALRSMSTFFGAIAIVFGYLFVHRSFGRKPAAYVLLALVLSPILLRYSQEMRMYTLVLAIGMIAAYVLSLATQPSYKGKKLWVLYGVLVSFSMWTHYFAAIIWLAHWAWRAGSVAKLRTVKTARRWITQFFSKEWLLAHAIAIGLFIPWLPFLLKQLFIVQAYGFWIPPVSPVTITNFFTNSVLYADQNTLLPWLTLGFVALVAMAVWLSVRGYKTLARTQKPLYWLLVSLAFTPIVLLLIASMPPLQSSFIDRYLVTSSIALAMLLGFALWFSWGVKRWIVPVVAHALVIGAFVIGLVSVYHYGNYNKISGEMSGAKQVIATIVDKGVAGEPIVAASPWMYYDAVFYENASHPVRFIDLDKYEYGSLEMLRTKRLNKITNVDHFLSSTSTFWYVGRSGDTLLAFDKGAVKEIERIYQADPTTGKPAYQAVRYEVIAE